MSLRLGTIRGIPIEIHLSWILIFGLVTFTLAVGLFPFSYPGQTAGVYWLMGAVAAVLFFGSVLLHELGHSFVALSHGIPIRKITLFIFGGVAQIGAEPDQPKVEFQVRTAVALVSITLAACFCLLARLFEAIGAGALLAITHYLSRINVMLATFNMVPAFPLDGGRVLRAGLWMRIGDLRRATGIAASVGQGFAFLLMFWGVLGIVGGQLLQGLWLMFIGWFLQQAAQSSYVSVALRESLSGIPVAQLMSTQVQTVPAHLPLRRLVDDFFYKYRYAAFPVVTDGNLSGMISLHEVRSVSPDRWDDVLVGQVASPLSAQDLIGPDADAADALMRMAQHDRGRLLVMRNGQLVGLISRTDILRLIKIQQQLRV